MKGWALAASLDSWCSLADPPLTEDPGDLGSGNSIFFFSFSVQRYFVCFMDLKGKQDFSQFLGANQPHWGSKVYPALAVWIWYGEQKVVASMHPQEADLKLLQNVPVMVSSCLQGEPRKKRVGA